MTKVTKFLQKQCLDAAICTTRNKCYVISSVLIIVFLFGYWCALWLNNHCPSFLVSPDWYSGILFAKSENSVYLHHVPVDVVYTWVNGSDPVLLENLYRVTQDNFCQSSLCFPSYYVFIESANPNILASIAGEKLMHDVHYYHSVHHNGVSKNFTIVKLPFGMDISVFIASARNHFPFYLILQAYWTSDFKNGWIVNTSTAVFILDADGPETEYLLALFPDNNHTLSDHCKIMESGKVMLIECRDSEWLNVMRNIVTSKSNIRLVPAYLLLQANISGQYGDSAVNRFQDNEELRYSLRSLEKYVPWIQHIYIVTNGQIPYWLDLDNPRLSIVTHDEIFQNKSHLPTFSSPAIEANIHRIPGLSEHFLYLNDDVLFGGTAYPEDFYTMSEGYKIYLSWGLPECSSGCPGTWLGDGYCDKACNTSLCDWDEGDCHANHSHQGADLLDFVGSDYDFNEEREDMAESCAPLCSQSWLADKFCDPACDVKACGYDCGDCGLRNLNKLYQIDYSGKDVTHYKLPKGVHAVWMNFSVLLQPGIKVKGITEKSRAIYCFSLNTVQKILMVVLQANASGTLFSSLSLSGNETTTWLNMTFEYDAIYKSTLRPAISENYQAMFPTYALGLVSPKILNVTEIVPDNFPFFKIKSDALALPGAIAAQFKNLDARFENGEISQRGLNSEKLLLLKQANLTVNLPDLPLYSHEDWQLMVKKVPYNETKFSPSRGLLAKLLTFGSRAVSPSEVSQSSSIKRKDPTWGPQDNFPIHDSSLDAFASSLLHVSKIYTKEYGFQLRKVPAHMPHFLNRTIVQMMQSKFQDEFEATSSHFMRHPEDMQYSFSYFYFVISEMVNRSLEELFDSFDTDDSGTWSDREIRTFLTRVNSLPIYYSLVRELHSAIRNCSSVLTLPPISVPPYERYADSDLPVVSKDLVLNCSPITALLKKLQQVHRFKYTIQSDSSVHFKMLTSNVSLVLQSLDEVRHYPRKFICLNSDLEPNHKDNGLIQALVRDMYEALFPVPSAFELPPHYRNRFSHLAELREWQRWRGYIRCVIYICLVCLVSITAVNYFGLELDSWRRRYRRRKLHRPPTFNIQI